MTTATKSRKATTKVVSIIARFQFKADARKVCYQVRSSNGTDTYTTCLFNGRACSCTCPATKPCYHMTQLEAMEAARNERAQAVKEAQRVIAKTAPRQFESYLSDEVLIATTQTPARKWTITDPTDAWYGLSDEQIATAIATYEMATDSRF